MPDPDPTGSPTSATTDSPPAGGTPPAAPVAAPGGDGGVTPPSGTPAAPVTPPAGTPPVAPVETSALGGDLPSGDPALPAGDPPAGDPATPPAPVLPEKYELALDGMTVDPALVELADPVFRELNLSNDQANQLLPVAQQGRSADRRGEVGRDTASGRQGARYAWLQGRSSLPPGAHRIRLRQPSRHAAARPHAWRAGVRGRLIPAQWGGRQARNACLGTHVRQTG